MRSWLPYWDVLASALHAQGKHRLELGVARDARRRFPDRIAACFPEARALAADRRLAELEQLWLQAATESDATTIQLGNLSYEVGSELWAHGDSNSAPAWFKRAYSAFGTGDESPNTVESRWGRARAAARLGRLREAFELAEPLAADDPTQLDYRGFLGVLAAQMGNQARAQTILEQLAAVRQPFTWGGPQFQAGRIAAVLGEVERATNLLASAYKSGYPYDLEFHRDQTLARLRGLPILHQLEARRE
jgi:tetratricopeptide (TPR) repeat protein